MENDGILLEKISPKKVIRQASQAKYISNADVWIEMISARNLMSRTYDLEGFFKMLDVIQKKIFPLLQTLYKSLQKDM